MIRESTIFLPPLLLGSIPFTKSNLIIAWTITLRICNTNSGFDKRQIEWFLQLCCMQIAGMVIFKGQMLVGSISLLWRLQKWGLLKKHEKRKSNQDEQWSCSPSSVGAIATNGMRNSDIISSKPETPCHAARIFRGGDFVHIYFDHCEVHSSPIYRYLR